MSTQHERDNHFFLAGWNGHLEQTDASQCFQQAITKAPTAVTELGAAPLPLLVRDIARDLGITSPEACRTLKPLGNFSVNSAVTVEMAMKLREQHSPTAPAGHVSAAAPDAFSLEELEQLRIAADDFQEGIDTTVDHDLLARGAIAGFLYCERFTVMDSAALDAAIATQAGKGE